MNPSWKTFVEREKQKLYFARIKQFIEAEKAKNKIIYPQEDNIFNALKYTPFSNTKVVILGQDPYHNPNQAHGLAFSVLPNTPLPPSLRNIYKELKSDFGHHPDNGCLIPWAKQGVLLLNTVLTVEQKKAHSHKDIGWETFTDAVIQALNDHPNQIIYLLWGAHAQQKIPLIDRKKHVILTAPHPSPLSAHRGFLGCKHFSHTNKLLKQNGRGEINWWSA